MCLRIADYMYVNYTHTVPKKCSTLTMYIEFGSSTAQSLKRIHSGTFIQFDVYVCIHPQVC